MTTLAAQFLLHERVDAVRWSGVALIMLGAAFISYGEHMKEKSAPPPAAIQGSAVK
jgi:drug/metabolite transporter (DMT)-like permease